MTAAPDGAVGNFFFGASPQTPIFLHQQGLSELFVESFIKPSEGLTRNFRPAAPDEGEIFRGASPLNPIFIKKFLIYLFLTKSEVIYLKASHFQTN